MYPTTPKTAKPRTKTHAKPEPPRVLACLVPTHESIVTSIHLVLKSQIKSRMAIIFHKS